MARCRDIMTCDTCAVDHMVRNPEGFHLCILKAIKNWTWEEARLNLPSAHSCHNNQSYLNWHYQIAIFSGWFVQSVYKVVTCLSVVRIELTLVAVVDQCTCASGIVTVDS